LQQGRQQIVEVAMKLFSEQGYKGVTIRSIADVLGWSSMKSYRYYENKLAIFVAVRDLAFTDLAVTLKAAADAVDDPLDKIYASGYAYILFSLEKPHVYNLCFSMDQRGMPEFQLMSDAAVSPWDLSVDSFRQAERSGQVTGDPIMASHLVWIGLHGLATLHYAGRLNFDRSVEDLVDPLIDSILAGFLTDRVQPRRTTRRSFKKLRSAE